MSLSSNGERVVLWMELFKLKQQGHCVMFLGKTIILTMLLSAQMYTYKWEPITRSMQVPCVIAF